jgi:hypothetical protein
LYKEEQQRGRTQYFSSGDNTIRNGNYFYIWGNRGDLLAEYASTYMFFQWFGIQATGGYNVYKEIIHEEKPDYRAVTAVAQRRLQAVTSPALSSEDAWTRLFGTWLAANAINEPYEYYGYKNKLDAVKVHSPLRTKVSLAPGEAVFSGAGDVMPENSGNLNHVAISLKKQTAYFDVTQERYDELKKDDGIDAIATYNSDTRASGAAIPVTITDFLSEPDNSRIDSAAEDAPHPVSGTILLGNRTR